MKLLDTAQLSDLSAMLSGNYGDVRVDTRIESYSCKMAGEDKRLFKQFSAQGDVMEQEQLSESPSTWDTRNSPPSYPGSLGAAGAFGAGSGLVHTCSRKTLFYLKATMNAAYMPDYDFSDAKSHEFCREPSLDWVKKTIGGNMQTAALIGFEGVAHAVWGAINEAITEKDTDVYSYNPDRESDPFGEDGCLWSFNYFWYNKSLKRILFFRGRALSTAASYGDVCDGDGDMLDEQYDGSHVDADMEY